MEFPPDRCTMCMQELLKIATGFSQFSLVYGTEAISLVELIIPTPRVVLEEVQEDTDSAHDKGRLADLEELKENREVARRRSQRY